MTIPLRPRWPVLAMAGLLCGGQAASGAPLAIDLPAQSLGTSIMQLAQTAGLSISVDAALVDDRQAPSVHGTMEPDRALQQLLEGSGLQLIPAGTNTYTIQPVPTVIEGDAQALDAITVEGAGPTTQAGPQRGLNLTREQLPSNVQSATSEEIRESRATSLTDFMSQNMQSVNINEYQGNPFQADVQFRGFSASPQIGTPQGLSLFFDGIRVNEPFGDVVNWDLIPLNAIQTFDVYPGSNPLFGLNTLGGALSIRTKNGFDDEGVQMSLLGGSWGRIQGQLAAGGNRGNLGGFVALTGFHEDGWRDNSPSDVKQLFSKVSTRNGPLELDATMMLAGTDLVGNGLIPQEEHDRNSSSVFTSPDETRNAMQQFSLSGLYRVNESFNITAQVYRRQSARSAIGGDIYEGFEELSPDDTPKVPFTAEEQGFPTCQYLDSNQDGLMDYFVDASQDFDGDGILDGGDGLYDPAVDGQLNPTARDLGLPQLDQTTPGFTWFALNAVSGCLETFYATGTDANGVVPVRNGAESISGDLPGYIGGTPITATLNTGVDLDGDGNLDTVTRTVTPGFTPIGVVTNSSIGQSTDGAALQLNWNLDQHALMVGASVDASEAEYLGFQRLALIDSQRNVFLAPDLIDPLFEAARSPITNNEFDGFSNTHSAYFSETYSPFENLHFSFAGRYNYTRVKNNLTARANSDVGDLHEFRNWTASQPDVILCPTTDPASCPARANHGQFDSAQALRENPDNFNDFSRTALTPTAEKYIYTSFNPSFGINFLPIPDVNIFANWSQGTRAPSVVELGCAYDPTLIDTASSDSDGDGINDLDGIPDTPRGLINPNACTLPSTLSGDPFLPQVVSRSTEFGLRGTLPNGWEWNTSLYRTNLFDDMYFVGGAGGQGNFQTIGDTRRQGLEIGLSGPINRWFDFSFSYGLTEATFQSQLYLISERNSSRLIRTDTLAPLPSAGSGSFDFATGKVLVQQLDMIDVQPGDRLPGVPLHNVNATLNFRPTERWHFGLNMIAHSGSYVRGNENNDHQPIGRQTFIDDENRVRTVNFVQPGEVGGYAVFNLKGSYKVDNHFTVFSQLNNILDKEYFSAGRLGVNPFSPSVNGAIGESGWNYNSNEWQSTTFVAPGAPRAFWIGVEYEF